MRKKITNIWSWVKDHKIWSTIIILIIISIAFFLIKGNSAPEEFKTVKAEIGALKAEVSVTGNVKPLSEVDLAFERGGKVATLSVAVGNRVSAGQYLASVSNADLQANLDQAKANLKKAKAALGNSADQSALSLSQAKISLVNSVKDSYTKADDAVRNKIFSLFNDPVRYNARLAFSTDTFLQEDIEEGKDDVVEMLEAWNRIFKKTDISLDVETNYQLAKTNLNQIKALLDKSAEAVNGLNTDESGQSQTQIDTWKLNVSTARTSINTAIDTLTTSYNQYKTAGLSDQIAEGSSLAEEASVEYALAQVASAEAELAKTIIRSPISGVITDIPIKLGEIVPANQKAISVISYGSYEVETFVPEADIAKIKIGNKAKATLDAYGDDVEFETLVIKIDPAATVIDGVPTYKVTLQFPTADERIRSGMTANLDILTAEKTEVLIIPSRAIISKTDGKYVFILDPIDPQKTVEKKIVVGLKGSDGMTEIVSGIVEGELIVTNPKI
ncbi:MAG: efflux RND transporter periplasmic adaptor subunit [Candidatus Paceibacterota bacterium]